MLTDAGLLTGWELSFSSPRLVVLARGTERIRLVASRNVPPASPPSLRLPVGAEVHLLGLYDPGPAAGRVPVALLRTAAPAVLVLKAYSRTRWAVTMAPGAQLAGVIVAGYLPSTVTGVPDGVPIVRLFQAAGAADTGSSYERAGLEGASRAVLGPDVVTACFAGAERAGGFEVR